MAQRLVKVMLPAERAGDLEEALDRVSISASWQEELDGGRSVVSVLCGSEYVEELLEMLDSRFGREEGFRAVVLSVEASLPDPGAAASPEVIVPGEIRPKAPPLRISREELYEDVRDGTELTVPYMVLICLSTVVAAIGLLRDSVAVVIGAMVIAPLLGPNVGLALSSTLGDGDLGRRALRTFLAGVLAALVLAAAVGLVVRPALATGEIASRTSIALPDLVLALAAGAAGVMAMTTGAPSAVIGVMVAVALLPPLVAAGLLLSRGSWAEGLGALVLFMSNVVCINLAGVVTFLLRGIKPMTWWEEGVARRSTVRALAVWTLLLALLVGMVALAG